MITAKVITGRFDYTLGHYKFSSTFLSTLVEDCLITSAVFSSVVAKDLTEDDVMTIAWNEYSSKGTADVQDKARQEEIERIFKQALEDSRDTCDE